MCVMGWVLLTLIVCVVCGARRQPHSASHTSKLTHHPTTSPPHHHTNATNRPDPPPARRPPDRGGAQKVSAHALQRPARLRHVRDEFAGVPHHQPVAGLDGAFLGGCLYLVFILMCVCPVCLRLGDGVWACYVNTVSFPCREIRWCVFWVSLCVWGWIGRGDRAPAAAQH